MNVTLSFSSFVYFNANIDQMCRKKFRLNIGEKWENFKRKTKRVKIIRHRLKVEEKR